MVVALIMTASGMGVLFGEASNLGPPQHFRLDGNDVDSYYIGEPATELDENVCHACMRRCAQAGWCTLQCGCSGVFCSDCVSEQVQCGWCTANKPSAKARQKNRGIDFSSWTEFTRDRPTTSWDWPSLAESGGGCSSDDTSGHAVAGQRIAIAADSVGMNTSHGDMCRGCAVPLYQPLIEWRMCICGTCCCVACAEKQCMDCGARFGGTAEHDNVTSTNPEFRRGEQSEGTTYAAPDSRLQALELTPGSALERRERLINDFRDQRVTDRAEWRQMVKQQRREGLRPRRKRNKHQGVRLITANVSGSGTLKQEISKSRAFQNAICLIQEHHEKGQGCRDFESWLTQFGLTSVIHEGYVKHRGVGGGTGVLGFAPNAVRPAPGASTIVEGRVSIGIADVGGDIAVGSVYGISSALVAKQLALWRALATYLRILGLPFVMGGDWQVRPQDLEKIGLL